MKATVLAGWSVCAAFTAYAAFLAVPALLPVDCGAAVENGGDFRECHLAGRDFSNRQLSGIRFDGADLSGADFSGSKLDNLTFTGALLDRAVFERTVIRDSQFSAASFRQARFDRVLISGSSFQRAEFGGAVLKTSTIVGSRFDRSQLTEMAIRTSRFEDSSFRDAVFTSSVIEDIRLHASDVSFARLGPSRIKSSSVSDVDIYGAAFDGVVAENLRITGLNRPGSRNLPVSAEGLRISKSCISESFFGPVLLIGGRIDDLAMDRVDLSGALLEGVEAGLVALTSAALGRDSQDQLFRLRNARIGRLVISRDSDAGEFLASAGGSVPDGVMELSDTLRPGETIECPGFDDLDLPLPDRG
jgi:uncharacterized protein YjbI with pentapeptide repeats